MVLSQREVTLSSLPYFDVRSFLIPSSTPWRSWSAWEGEQEDNHGYLFVNSVHCCWVKLIFFFFFFFFQDTYQTLEDNQHHSSGNFDDEDNQDNTEELNGEKMINDAVKFS